MTSALKLFQGRFGRVALLDSDQDLVTHTHPQCHVLIKADGADTSFMVRGRRVPLDDDTLVLVNAWEPHAKVHPSPGERSTVLALYIEPEWLAACDPKLGVCGRRGFFPEPCALIPPAVRAAARRVIREMLEGGLQAGAGAARQARWEGALFELMMAVIFGLSAWREAAALQRAGLLRAPDPRIERAIALMREDLSCRDAFDEIARRCHLSRPHFFHLFRASTSVPPAIYLNTLRMEAAFGQLPGRRASMDLLAQSLGFSEPHHFGRFFRRNLGIPPGEYRRRVDLFA